MPDGQLAHQVTQCTYQNVSDV